MGQGDQWYCYSIIKQIKKFVKFIIKIFILKIF